jgi:hypothetical protein
MEEIIKTWYGLSMELKNGEVEEVEPFFNFKKSVENLGDEMMEILDDNLNRMYKGYLIHTHFEFETKQ